MLPRLLPVPVLFVVLAGGAAGCGRANPVASVEDAATLGEAGLLEAGATPPSDAAAEATPEASEVDAASLAPVSPFADTHYKRVLHTGDSMVGGGLCKALAPRFAKEETKVYVRDPWESASIFAFAYTDHLPKLMAKVHPDLVLLTLGANDVYGNVTKDFTRAIEKVVAITQRGGPRDCVWLGPPIWNPKYKPTVEAIREHAAPCVFYDSSDLVIARRRDRIHPTDVGGETWAVDFWRFFRGAGADGADAGKR